MKTSALRTTELCYTEETRNLNYRIRCENLEDFRNCVRYIGSYNEFSLEAVNRIILLLETIVPCRDLFFDIGREGSPVVYVKTYVGNIKSMFGVLLEANGKKYVADEIGIEDQFSLRLWFD